MGGHIFFLKMIIKTLSLALLIVFVTAGKIEFYSIYKDFTNYEQM